jgi:hypothetical protein
LLVVNKEFVMVNRTPLLIDDVLKRIRDPLDSFTFSRWGDGEWRAVFRQYTDRRNCDRHRYFPDMGHELFKVLADKPEYIMGMQGLAMRVFGDRILAHIDKAGIQDMEWVDSDVFHQASLHGKLHKIVAAVNTRRVIMVGPPALRQIKDHETLPLNYWQFIEVPARDAYRRCRQIIEEIENILNNYQESREPLLISVCASMPAEIILHKIYPLTKGRHTAIDFGSLWDPLAGIASRGYHRDRGVAALVNARNEEEHKTEAMGATYESQLSDIESKESEDAG